MGERRRPEAIIDDKLSRLGHWHAVSVRLDTLLSYKTRSLIHVYMGVETYILEAVGESSVLGLAEVKWLDSGDCVMIDSGEQMSRRPA